MWRGFWFWEIKMVIIERIFWDQLEDTLLVKKQDYTVYYSQVVSLSLNHYSSVDVYKTMATILYSILCHIIFTKWKFRASVYHQVECAASTLESVD